MKLSVPQRFTLVAIAQAGDDWRYADDWHASVVTALERRGLVEVTTRADGGWAFRMVRATPAGLVLGHGGGER